MPGLLELTETTTDKKVFQLYIDTLEGKDTGGSFFLMINNILPGDANELYHKIARQTVSDLEDLKRKIGEQKVDSIFNPLLELLKNITLLRPKMRELERINLLLEMEKTLIQLADEEDEARKKIESKWLSGISSISIQKALIERLELMFPAKPATDAPSSSSVSAPAQPATAAVSNVSSTGASHTTVVEKIDSTD